MKALEGIFRCQKCKFRWRIQRFQCSECDYTLVHIKDFLTTIKIGYGSSIPLRHSPNSCGCPGPYCECFICVEILKKVGACKHQMANVAPGPTECPKCSHGYLDWLNYPL